MARRVRSRREVRLAAWLACALWLLGVEVGPGLHVALHDHLPRHAHGVEVGPEVVVHLDGEWHSHGGQRHTHDRAASPDGRGPEHGVDRRSSDPARHAAHSLAHRAMAVAPPPIAVVTPAPVARTIVPVAYAIARLVAAPIPPDAGARGPPVA